MKSGDILEELTALRRIDAEKRAEEIPFGAMLEKAKAAPAAKDFAASLLKGGIRIIAELKRASPSEGMIREDFRPRELARELSGAGAAALSVLCEPHRFLGGEEYLRAAREECGLPVLYKDFVSTRYQIAAARAAGADAILLIAAVLDTENLEDLLGFAHGLGMQALVETHDENEIAAAAGCGAQIVGVNCRDLRNFSTDVSLLERLLAKAPARCVRVAESGMHSAEAVARAKDAGADGFLVGTALMRAQRPGEKLAELIKGAKRK